MIFKTPLILLFIPFVIAGVIIHQRRQKVPTVRFPSDTYLTGMRPTWRVRLLRQMPVVRLVILLLFVVALAGPQSVREKVETKGEGIDIVLTLDASGSMAAEDFVVNGKRVNRLSVAKDVIAEFVKGRASDRLGLVVFAPQAYTICPLTIDYDWLLVNLDRVDRGTIGQDGTAIGSAIATSLNRLRTSSAKSKVIILLTDGVNNTGKVTPLAAAQAAAALGVKIYTIGVGSKGLVPYPVEMFGRTMYQNVQIDLDEETLQEVAKTTGGMYFRAKDTQSLRTIYKTIDAMEKTDIEQTGYREFTQLFPYVLAAALVLLVVELALRATVLAVIP